MFGVGMGELVVIAIIALLFLGPDKIPDAAKAIGKGIRDFRKHTRDLQETLEQDTELGDAVRDLRSALQGEEPRIQQRRMPPKVIPKPKPLPEGGAPPADLPVKAVEMPPETPALAAAEPSAPAADVPAAAAAEPAGDDAPPAEPGSTSSAHG